MLVAVTFAVGFAPPSVGSLNVVTQPRGHSVVMQQNGAIDRRAAILSAGALAFGGNSAAWAKGLNPKAEREAGLANTVFKVAFDQSTKLVFGDRGWGDAEAKVLSQSLTRSSAVSKLILSGNTITDEGAAALATSLRAGAAPKLKTINLAGNAVWDFYNRCLP